MKITPLTILTEPTSIIYSLMIKTCSSLNKLYDFIREPNENGKKRDFFLKNYDGHPAVTRSLIEGLEKVNYPFNYNPKLVNEIYENVIVLSNIHALKQAIALKKRRKIKKLLAGPNLMVFSNEHNHILVSPEIDKIIVPSKWVRIAYDEDEPLLSGKIVIWGAGVNEEYWRPAASIKTEKNVLLYCKTESKKFWEKVETILINHGWCPIILEYGKYSSEKFKNLLENCIFSVFISRSESQGIALAEAWSMNVPTLVWNPKKLTYKGRDYSEVSSCPYLSSETGLEWNTIDELITILNQIDQILEYMHPREWILNNLTDAICAKKIIEEF